MKTKLTNKIIIVLLVVSAILSAQEFKKTATAGFTFLQIPATAKTAALGEASIGLADKHSSAVFSNPAALGFSEQNHSASVSYAPWFADIKHYAASYATNTRYGKLAVSAFVLDYGEMPRTTISFGQKVYDIIGYFKANAASFGVTYSNNLTDRFSFGVTVKYVQEKIDIYSAENIVFDGGVLYYTGFRSLRLAAVIQNFGVDARFLNDEFKMPATFRLGVAMELMGDYESEYRVTAVIDGVHPNDGEERVNTGLEFCWNNMLLIRGGYKLNYDEETFSAGIGLNPVVGMPVTVDYAIADYGRLGYISRFTLNLGIN